MPITEPAADGAVREGGSALVRDLVRDDVVLSAQTWVVKVGTSVLTGPDGTLDPARIGHLAEQISLVMDQGRRVGLSLGSGPGPGWASLGGSGGRRTWPASGCGGGWTGLSDSCLRRRPAPAKAACGTTVF